MIEPPRLLHPCNPLHELPEEGRSAQGTAIAFAGLTPAGLAAALGLWR